MISISGHKIFGPKGIGAFITRRRARRRIQVSPLQYGGGQERGIRPGTQAVHLIAALGKASEVALRDLEARTQSCMDFRNALIAGLESLNPVYVSDTEPSVPAIVSLRFVGLDAEAVMLKLKPLLAISNGSACTSDRMEPSHVFLSMGLSEQEAYQVTRWSWSHRTPAVPWAQACREIRELF